MTTKHHQIHASLRAAVLLLGLGAGLALQAADYSSTVLSYGPVGYWRLNETATVPAAPIAASLGSVPNSTGFGVLDVGLGEPGLVGGAFRFRNVGPVVGYCGSRVDVPFNAAMNPEGSFTVEFWAKPSAAVSDLFCPLSALNGDGGVRDGWLFYQSGANDWIFRIGGGAGYAALARGGTVTPNAWQQVVGVYYASNNSVSIYVNGAKAAGPVVAGIPFVANDGRAFRLGGTGLTGTLGSFSGNRAFDGWLDEVAIYPGVLSADRISAHYTTATTNPGGYAAAVLADSPLGYWNLDEPAYSAPDPGSFPTAANLGSAGAAADGHYTPGTSAGVAGPTFNGLGGANSKAAWFNGIVGEVSVPNADALNNATAVTVMAWVKAAQADNVRDILAHGYVTSPDNHEFYFRLNAGHYEVGIWDGNDSNASADMSEGDVGNWVFLAGTFDGTTWKLYRYGEVIAVNDNGVGPGPFDGAWGIGAMGDAETQSPAEGVFFAGSLAEVALFDKVLTGAQILEIFNAATPTPILLQALEGPASQLFVGDSLTLSVVADGLGPFSYRWLKGGAEITGQTGSSLALSNLQVADGGTYTVEVGNANGVTSSTVSFTVKGAPPEVTKQPDSISRFVGTSAAFTAKVTGSAPLTYQWYHGTAAVDGATTATLTIPVVSAASAGEYTCKAVNAFGNKTTDPALLTVVDVPAGLGAAIVADKPVAYYRLNEASGAAIAHDLWGGHDGKFHNVTLGVPGYSLVDSDTAASFGASGSFVGDISGTEVNFTGTATAFTLEAWVRGSTDQPDGAGIIAKGPGSSGGSGDEQFALDITGGKYRFYVRAQADRAPAIATAAEGPNGSWQHVVGVYDGAAGYLQLYVNGAASGDSANTPASGPRASSHPVSIGARRGGVDPSYDLYLNGSLDEVAIYSAALSSEQVLAHFNAQYGSNQRPLIEVQPVPVTYYASLPISLNVAAAGTQPIAYQWYKGATLIANATEPKYTIDPAQLSSSGDYHVKVSNAVGETNSVTVKVTVLPVPTSTVGTPGLVAHYGFENNLRDATGRGNDGSPVGAISYVDGKIGAHALHYSTAIVDETNIVSSYVTLGVRPDLQFGTASFSVAFWVRLPANYADNDLPFISNAEGSANTPGYTFAPSYSTTVVGGWGWSLFGVTGGGINVYGDVGTINDGGWHHLLFSFDRSASGNTYLDGKLVDSRSVTVVGNLDTGKATNIGQDPTGKYGEPGSADLDDIGVWNRALTPLEAAGIYLAASVNGVSFENKTTSGPIAIALTTDGKVQLSWPAGGTLQAADNVAGPYSDVSGAGNPHVTTPTGSAKFYRAKF